MLLRGLFVACAAACLGVARGELVGGRRKASLEGRLTTGERARSSLGQSLARRECLTSIFDITF